MKLRAQCGDCAASKNFSLGRSPEGVTYTWKRCNTGYFIDVKAVLPSSCP